MGLRRAGSDPLHLWRRSRPRCAAGSASALTRSRSRCRSPRSSPLRPGCALPTSSSDILSADPADRIRHSMGRAYRDVVRGFRGRFDRTPDMVAFPGDAEDVRRVLEMCADRRLAAVPFGGGTSVVGGVEPRVGHGYRGTVSIDLGALSGIVEIDEVSSSALIRAGTLGPDLEDGLRPRGLTLRHFPQSFEFSTLGGWIATRAGGHFATLQTHIDDLVDSITALTPTGLWESRRLPGSGAGPSPDRMILGSEGILGVITEAWVRVRPRPRFKASRPVLFESFAAGAEAARVISQSGLHPSNCRLLDPARGGDHRGLGRLLRRADRRVRIRLRARRRVRCGWRSNAPPASAGGPRTGGTPGATRPPRPGARPSSTPPTCATASSASGCSARPSRRRSPGTGSASSTRGSARRRGGRSPRSPTLRRTARGRRGSCAASPTSIPAVRPPITRCSPRPGAARRSSSGTRSRRPSRRRSSPPAGRSPITTRSAAIIAPGTTCSDPIRSRRRSARPRRRSTRRGSSTRAS